MLSSVVTQAGTQPLTSCMTPQTRTLKSPPSTVSVESYYLPPLPPGSNKKTLILDLDETLVHSAFQPVDNVDLVLPVEIEGILYYIYVLKRPGVEDFLKCVSKFYEVVIFTASLSKYADPLIDLLDPHHYTSHRLFREHCVFYNNTFVKDLTMLGRKLENTIIVDNSPNSYLFQPQNALPIQTWIDDPSDKSLYELIPILEALSNVQDVRRGLGKIVKEGRIDYVEALRTLKENKATLRDSRMVNQWVKPQMTLAQPENPKHEVYDTKKAKTRSSTPGILNMGTGQKTIRPGSSASIRAITNIGVNSPKAKGAIIAKHMNFGIVKSDTLKMKSYTKTPTPCPEPETKPSSQRNRGNSARPYERQPVVKLKSEKISQFYSNIMSRGDLTMKKRDENARRPLSYTIDARDKEKSPFTPCNGRNTTGKNLLAYGTPKGKRAFSVKNTMHTKENSTSKPTNLFYEKIMAATLGYNKDAWKVVAPASTRNSTAVILKPNLKKAYQLEFSSIICLLLYYIHYYYRVYNEFKRG
eukprot:TRINITY_DN3131_c0_g1_i1.p3 TRINITY_DN3131_c0_g1~~TRINITY_DN3131_c0_g1_i1.p3  ORF type:complete len:527 (+),score=26.89 TRINITY_DN3131_c0_g1_i1:1740-3320(+)